ncbi:MAG TPA: hypothetical protein DCZ13_11155 [Porticoccaceae bacterium]|nr:hypothetical protein [Porticoccaceae bacterium]
MDATRFDQFGHWEGEIRYPDGDIQVKPELCHGTKDRSWGVRNFGKSAHAGAPQPPSSLFFIWAPLFWEDHISHALSFEGPSGEALAREALTAPLYKSTDEVPEGDAQGIEHMAAVAHRLQYQANTRRISYAEVDLTDLKGNVRTIAFEPILRFHMKGLGYFHPTWCQGVWQGEMEIGGEVFDPLALDLTDAHNLHMQQVVRVSDGTRQGMGVLEHLCVGPYEPYGFTDFFSGVSL